MKQSIQEDGAVAAPGNLTTGVEAPKLPIKPKNIFKRIKNLKKKREKREYSTTDFL